MTTPRSALLVALLLSLPAFAVTDTIVFDTSSPPQSGSSSVLFANSVMDFFRWGTQLQAFDDGSLNRVPIDPFGGGSCSMNTIDQGIASVSYMGEVHAFYIASNGALRHAHATAIASPWTCESIDGPGGVAAGAQTAHAMSKPAVTIDAGNELELFYYDLTTGALRRAFLNATWVAGAIDGPGTSGAVGQVSHALAATATLTPLGKEIGTIINPTDGSLHVFFHDETTLRLRHGSLLGGRGQVWHFEDFDGAGGAGQLQPGDNVGADLSVGQLGAAGITVFYTDAIAVQANARTINTHPFGVGMMTIRFATLTTTSRSYQDLPASLPVGGSSPRFDAFAGGLSATGSTSWMVFYYPDTTTTGINCSGAPASYCAISGSGTTVFGNSSIGAPTAGFTRVTAAAASISGISGTTHFFEYETGPHGIQLHCVH